MSHGLSDPNHPSSQIPNGTIVTPLNEWGMRPRDRKAMHRQRMKATDPAVFGRRWHPSGGWTNPYSGAVLRELRGLRGVGPVSYLSDRQ